MLGAHVRRVVLWKLAEGTHLFSARVSPLYFPLAEALCPLDCELRFVPVGRWGNYDRDARLTVAVSALRFGRKACSLCRMAESILMRTYARRAGSHCIAARHDAFSVRRGSGGVKETNYTDHFWTAGVGRGLVRAAGQGRCVRVDTDQFALPTLVTGLLRRAERSAG